MKTCIEHRDAFFVYSVFVTVGSRKVLLTVSFCVVPAMWL